MQENNDENFTVQFSWFKSDHDLYCSYKYGIKLRKKVSQKLYNKVGEVIYAYELYATKTDKTTIS